MSAKVKLRISAYLFCISVDAYVTHSNSPLRIFVHGSWRGKHLCCGDRDGCWSYLIEVMVSMAMMMNILMHVMVVRTRLVTMGVTKMIGSKSCGRRKQRWAMSECSVIEHRRVYVCE